MSKSLGGYITSSHYPFLVPSAPIISSIQAALNGIYMAIDPPDQGGSPITLYYAVAVNIATGAVHYISSGSTTLFIPTGAGSFIVRVYAKNSYGSGAYSVPSSSITVQAASTPSSVDYLVVAGGGAAGWPYSGGGGAGGYIASTANISAGTTYTITVGAGGAGVSSYDAWVDGANGSNSSAFSSTAIGGGGGGRLYNSGKTGGSGGGGGGTPGGAGSSGGAGTSGQGNSGSAGGYGIVQASALPTAGAGGGAGAVGGAYSTLKAGDGGAGLNWLSLGTYYAGGGGGMIEYKGAGTGTEGGAGGIGGLGGGGYGSGGTAGAVGPQAGTANTGGGGGADTGAGGSGVVIIRIPTSNSAPTIVGSPIITLSGSYGYFKFTGSGSVTW